MRIKNLDEMIILAIDYGEKKLGLAFKGFKTTDIATIGNFKNTGDVINKVVYLCKDYKVDLVLIGYPLSENYGKNRQTLIVEKFAKVLFGSLPKKVHLKLFNERFTTQEAKNLYYSSKGKKTQWQNQKDTLSAKILLTRFFLENDSKEINH